jgi:hypothetical protein
MVIHSYILLPLLRQGHRLFHSLFSTECDLVLSLSVSNILSFPQGHPAAAYIIFLVLPSVLSIPLSSIQ